MTMVNCDDVDGNHRMYLTVEEVFSQLGAPVHFNFLCNIDAVELVKDGGLAPHLKLLWGIFLVRQFDDNILCFTFWIASTTEFLQLEYSIRSFIDTE